jgi:uncharacterized membrane protein YvbJ
VRVKTIHTIIKIGVVSSYKFGENMPIPRYCSNCGALVNENAAFCSKCGTVLSNQQPNISELVQPTDAPFNSSVFPSSQTNESLEQLGKAYKRAKLFSYIIIGLTLIILVETFYWFGFFG